VLCSVTRVPERRSGRSDDDLRQQRRDDEHAWHASLRGGTVLFIDCLPDEQEMYGDALRHAGIEPVIVCDGLSAFERAVSTCARVVVIDLTPRDGGLDLIRRFRGDSRTRASTIIAVSAQVFPADRAAAEHAGCDVFLSKPCPPDTLVAEVRCVLTRLNSERAS